MDKNQENETSAKISRSKLATIPNSKSEITKKFKILSSLSDLIKFVVSDKVGVLSNEDVVEQLFNIAKMLNVESWAILYISDNFL